MAAMGSLATTICAVLYRDDVRVGDGGGLRALGERRELGERDWRVHLVFMRRRLIFGASMNLVADWLRIANSLVDI